MSQMVAAGYWGNHTSAAPSMDTVPCSFLSVFTALKLLNPPRCPHFRDEETEVCRDESVLLTQNLRNPPLPS